MMMLTSLKALLFPTSAKQGVKGDAAPTEGSAGFAQLLNSVGIAPTADAQPVALTSLAADGTGVDNNSFEYQQVDVNSWHPALASATPSTGLVTPSPDAEKPHVPVQLAVALPTTDESPAAPAPPPTIRIATSADPVPAKDDEARTHSALQNEAEALTDLVPVRTAQAPIDPIPAAGDEDAKDVPAIADAAPSTATASPEQAEDAVAVRAPIMPMAVTPAPIAPVAVEEASAPAPVKLPPAHLHHAAPVETIMPSLPATMSDVPETDAASGEDAAPATQDDSKPVADPTLAVVASPVPVVGPIVAQIEPVPAETMPVAASGPSLASPAAAAPSIGEPSGWDAPVDRASRIVTEADKSPRPIAAMPPAATPPLAGPAPTPPSPVAIAPAVSAAPASPAKTVIAPVDDMAVDKPAIGQPASTPAPAPAPAARTPSASDVPIDSVSMIATEADISPSPIAAVPLAATPSLAGLAPPPASSVATAPAVSAAPALPDEVAIAQADLPVDAPAIGQPAAAPASSSAPTSAAPPAPTAIPPAGQHISATPAQAARPSSEMLPVSESVVPIAEVGTVAAPTEPEPATAAIPELAPDLAEIADQAPDLAQVATPTAPVKPRAEAVSLLQLVRDHMSLRAPRRTETAVPVGDTSADTASVILTTAVNDSTPPLAPLVQPAAPPLATAAPAIPTVDLSASLGAQVVDMGVSGQWIDGLARDIAGLSANGAQGRFQINATELGPIQVDIRQGDDGAAISLTVATEAAEQALRQDSDRLKLDASLSAVRISEVKIERAPHAADVARTDSATSQSTTQQQSGSSSQNPGQAAGQNMGQSSAQSNMQGRGQQRENIAFGHKAGNDGAVLNHMDAGDTAGGAARARYA